MGMAWTTVGEITGGAKELPPEPPDMEELEGLEAMELVWKIV
jgi:hypothetical protein